jgi:hypothetical protein
MRWTRFRTNRTKAGARVQRVVTATALLTALACSGSTTEASTVATSPPLASSPSPSAPGTVTYTAETFMKGMKVTVPSGDWTVYEDHPGEFNIAAPAPAEANIHFWLDPYPSLKDDQPLPGVGRTASELVGWLSGDPNFVVSDHATGEIDGNSATTFLLDLSGDCIDYFVFQTSAYDFPYGTCPGNPARLYITTLGAGAKAHTFVISVDAKNKKTFESIIPAARKIIANVSLPTKVSAG